MNVNSQNSQAPKRTTDVHKNHRSTLAANNNNSQPNPPQAYIDGVQDFYGRDCIVTPDVLIPRPETEQIIDIVLSLAGKPYLPGIKPTTNILPPKPQILDVGTGSGCIAITIKRLLPQSIVTATDISASAIGIAQKNAQKHGVSLSFIISNLLENVKFTPDILVANLPYVDHNWDWLDQKSLSFEPEIALYAKQHGLALIYQLINQAATRNFPRLILEADPSQHQSIIYFAKKHHYQLVEIRGFILHFVFNA